ncbi:MAG: lipopolysaccharide assembly protein LapA domain-containing protein [Rhodospirillales bacterium]|nr:lipopolysaccharide assembly protein LapA domain-containing protein [Rhodospirillales bacterium]MCY4004115.1 lipopolysaccharide assembly protein LapA domain-containing protein [Rhodospirillales bacterium]MCY4096831.1 lipopolysaccharide assembly protein LapA domain-containing protein [Rhodospirillales bacterium]MDE0371160.1 lipopolysaccharide assembly protein LapA domain-containing protein [Rhodospirillales bacterium]MXX22051.1 DUF1049 domain-containing protein [Rhodospirillales bacterium]
MLRLARRIAVLILALLFIPFALSNRQGVALAFWPFEGVVEVPLYLLLVAVLALGIVLGGLVRLVERLGSRGRPGRASS